jgi:hypothetical protein
MKIALTLPKQCRTRFLVAAERSPPRARKRAQKPGKKRVPKSAWRTVVTAVAGVAAEVVMVEVRMAADGAAVNEVADKPSLRRKLLPPLVETGAAAIGVVDVKFNRLPKLNPHSHP